MEWRDHPVGIAFTDRHGGVSRAPFDSLNLGRTDCDSTADIAENFRRLRRRLAVDKIVTVAQVHGTDVVEVDKAMADHWHDGSELGDSVPGGEPLVRADALVTTLPDVALCIRVADCAPVLFYDPVVPVIGAAHAGRVGLLAGVLVATVDAMRDLGAQNIEVWIGPYICGGCYEVPAEMAEAAWRVIPETKCETRWGTPSIDLGAGAEAQLRRDVSGVSVVRLNHCTFEAPHAYFSHRRDHGATGRQAGLIWLRRGGATRSVDD